MLTDGDYATRDLIETAGMIAHGVCPLCEEEYDAEGPDAAPGLPYHQSCLDAALDD
jgi:hypothetical protein